VREGRFAYELDVNISNGVGAVTLAGSWEKWVGNGDERIWKALEPCLKLTSMLLSYSDRHPWVSPPSP
jgi:hypothetical protein